MTVTATRYAEVNDVPLDTYAWRVVDTGYDQLLSTPALRGSDLAVPGAPGVRPYPRIVDVTLVSIPLLIIGSLDEDGDPISDPVEGMFQHRDYLAGNLGLPGTTGVDPDRGTVSFVFHRGGALNALEGVCTVLGLMDFTRLGEGDATVRLDLSLPNELVVGSGS